MRFVCFWLRAPRKFDGNVAISHWLGLTLPFESNVKLLVRFACDTRKQGQKTFDHFGVLKVCRSCVENISSLFSMVPPLSVAVATANPRVVHTHCNYVVDHQNRPAKSSKNKNFEFRSLKQKKPIPACAHHQHTDRRTDQTDTNTHTHGGPGEIDRQRNETEFFFLFLFFLAFISGLVWDFVVFFLFFFFWHSEARWCRMHVCWVR